MINLTNWLTNLVSLFTFYGGGGGGGDTTTVQKADPWEGVQPYIKDFLSKGSQVTQQPFQFYNGDTIAGFSPEQEAGFKLNTQRALAGSPTLNAANNQVTSTINGDYLSPDSNPYFKGTVDRAMDDVQTRINSQFSGNNFNNSAHQELLTRNLGDVANSMYSQNYMNERNNQLGAVSQAPTLAMADYTDGNVLAGIGAQRQGLAQSYLTDAKNTFNEAANYPYQQLDRYGNLVSIGMGAGGTSTSSSDGGGSSPLTGALGGGLAGYGMASTLGLANPWIGAGVGVLGGLLG